MRGTRNLSIIITLCLSIVAVGCGVAADDTAATVGGQSVSIESVNDVARDPLFAADQPADLVDYLLPGDMARSALSFEITRVAWISEAERWGLDLDQARKAATSELDNQLAQNPPPGGISDSMRKLFIDYYAAQMALEERFKTIDSGDTADLQRLYEGVPGLWERTCAWIVNVPAGSGAKAQKLVDKGAKVKDIPDELEGATIVADPTQSCISDSSMPAELATDIRALPLNKASDVLSLTSAGVTQSFVAEVEGRESLTFKDAKTDLVGIADSLKTQGPKAWIDLIVSTATVDSRFGSSIQNGQSGPVITPPLAPVAPASNDALPGAGQAPTATAPGAAGSDTGQ